MLIFTVQWIIKSCIKLLARDVGNRKQVNIADILQNINSGYSKCIDI